MGGLAQNRAAAHLEVGLALPADVSHCEWRARVAHNEGVFGQETIPKEPPERQRRHWWGAGHRIRGAGWGSVLGDLGRRGAGLPEGGVDLLLCQVTLRQVERMVRAAMCYPRPHPALLGLAQGHHPATCRPVLARLPGRSLNLGLAQPRTPAQLPVSASHALPPPLSPHSRSSKWNQGPCERAQRCSSSVLGLAATPCE